MNKTVDVSVTEQSYVSTLNQAFFYDADNTPTINSIQPNILRVEGGELINVEGVNFPILPELVLIGKKQAKVKFSNRTLLILMSPDLEPGSYKLTIPNPLIGNSK